MICFYCNKVFVSRFRDKTIIGIVVKSIEQFLKVLENDEAADSKKEMIALRDVVWQACVDQQKYNITINKSVVDRARSLVHSKYNKVEIEKEPDQVWDEDYYKTIHGDWRTNGKGHVFGEIQGEKGVIVPGAPIRKIRRIEGQRASINSTVDDGKVQLTATSLEDKMKDVAQGFAIPKAVGMCLNPLGLPSGGLLGGSSSSIQGGYRIDQGPLVMPNAAGDRKKDDGDDNPFGFKQLDDRGDGKDRAGGAKEDAAAAGSTGSWSKILILILFRIDIFILI